MLTLPDDMVALVASFASAARAGRGGELPGAAGAHRGAREMAGVGAAVGSVNLATQSRPLTRPGFAC